MDNIYTELLRGTDFRLPTELRSDYIAWKYRHPEITPEEFNAQGLHRTIDDNDYCRMICLCVERFGLPIDKPMMMRAIMTACKGKANPRNVSDAIDLYIEEVAAIDDIINATLKG